MAGSLAARVREPARGLVRPTAVLVASILCMLMLAACGGGDRPRLLELQGRTMGTSYSVQIADAGAVLDGAKLQQRIETLLAEINAQMSTYDPQSELSRFNRSASEEWFAVSAALAEVVAEARQISAISHGAFDVTVGRLVNLWGFGPEFHLDQVPSAAAIAEQLAATGDQHLAVRLEPPALRKALPGLYVDLSAIAKGYAVDQVAELLDGQGLSNYLVEIGGELRARGERPDRPWRIAIERPESQGRAVYRVVELADIGMATSGDYRNFFQQDGVFYSHTIDPSTGRPVAHRLASVTVLDAETMRADALATAFLVLGPEQGLALAEAMDIPAFFIERTATDPRDYQPAMTSAFERLTAGANAPRQ